MRCTAFSWFGGRHLRSMSVSPSRKRADTELWPTRPSHARANRSRARDATRLVTHICAPMHMPTLDGHVSPQYSFEKSVVIRLAEIQDGNVEHGVLTSAPVLISTKRARCASID